MLLISCSHILAHYIFIVQSRTIDCLDMPMFLDSNARAIARFSPLKSNVDDMITAVEKIEEELEFVVDDSEAFGMLTEDTFMENCPEILKQMERISALAENSTRDLTFEDEAFEPVESVGLGTAMDLFLTHYCVVLSILSAHSKAIKSTGPYYDSLSRSINRQRSTVQQFRNAIEARYSSVKVRTATQWTEVDGATNSVLEKFPQPTHIIVVEQ